MKVFKILVVCAMLAFSLSAFSQNREKIVVMNHPPLEEILKEFQDGCRFYNVDYEDQLFKLDAIKIIKGKYTFMGRVDKNVIEVNSELAEYPNLLRIIVLRQLGKYLGLEELDAGREIMSNTWKITDKEETAAKFIRVRSYQRDAFFRSLERHLPVEREM